MTNTETKLISINAALAERAERLRAYEAGKSLEMNAWALRAQIRDLETEKHALLQELPL